MRFERKYAVALLAALWAMVLYAMYSALFRLGPLKEELLRFEGDPMRHGYKIFFFSMETAAITYLAFTVLLVASILYLRSKDMKWDVIGSSSAKIGIVFTTILLVNGAIFSKVGWGAYWNWDPRQTTSLMLWFILAAYLSLRTAIDSDETRARLSAIIGIFGFVGVPLTHVSATIWVSNHPQLYNQAGKAPFSLDKAGVSVFMMMMLGVLVLYLYFMWLTVKIERLNQKVLSGER
ncbi:MAG: cytochrome C assembly protein [Methanobacteriota archaeon]|nr:MAG: cytochrome C assembly protein [Euryarchaeota archaeon]